MENKVIHPAEVELTIESWAGQVGQVLQDGWVCGAEVQEAEDAQHCEVGVLAPIRVE